MPASPRVKTPIRGSNLDNVRRNNLSQVLGLVHTRRGVSRAQLTKELGLNRSTIAALVTELVQHGLVVESEPVQTNLVGRPSPMIEPSDSVVAICVNPELDAVTIGLVGLGGTVLRRVRYDNVRIPTPQEVINVVGAVLDSMGDSLDEEFTIVGMGLAIPGLVRGSDGMVDLAPHLGWRDEPFAAALSEATGYRVVAANDASCGAVAEHTFGAGQAVNDMIYLNGGASGIGGGIIVDGVPLRGANGYAGELGHTLVNSAGSRCHCGSEGCLETEVSRAELLAACGLTDADAESLDTVLAELYSAGPTRQLAAIVERQVGFLVVAVRNAVNVFNTRRIVLGGFLGSLHRVAPELFDPITKSTDLISGGTGVEVYRAALGTNILMVGAAELAFAELLADPARVGRLGRVSASV